MVTNNLTYVVSLNNSALDVFYAKFHSDILHVYAFELEFISTSATMENIRLFLCPEIPMDKIVERGSDQLSHFHFDTSDYTP